MPVTVIDAEGALEASLAENLVRKAMRPYELYEAIAGLKLSQKAIAARFALPIQTVREAQRLGRLHPRQHWRPDMMQTSDAAPDGDGEDRGASATITPTQDAPGPWRCFHCGDVFTSERQARLHFGRDEGSTVACVIKGADGGLLRALRDAEEQADDAIQMMHAESTDAAKAYHAQRCRHSQSLMSAEEAGYERGLADGRSVRDPCRCSDNSAELVAALEAMLNTGGARGTYDAMRHGDAIEQAERALLKAKAGVL